MDAQRLGFRDASFDVAMGAFSIHLLPDPRAGVAEAARVLPTGRHLRRRVRGADFDAQVDFYQDLLGDGSFRIVNRLSGLVLDGTGASTAQGTKLEQWTWNGGPWQRFKLGVSNGKWYVYNTQSGMCVDVPGSSTQPGTQLILWTCNYGLAQTFNPIST